MLLLTSSDPKNAAYIETKSLDGETNLKFKKVHKDMMDKIKSEEDIKAANF